MLRIAARGTAGRLAVALALLVGCSVPLERTTEAAAQTPVRGPSEKAPAAAAATAKGSSEGASAAREEPAPKRTLSFVAGGDVNFGRNCGQAILERPDYAPFRFVAPFWEKADLRFVNLESPLSDQNGETQSPRHHLLFTGPPGGAEVLAKAGIGVVSTANNHAWDYGRSALFETLDHLTRAGIKGVGTGRTREQALSPVIIEVAGYKLAIFAVTHVWNHGPMKDHAARHYVAWARFSDLRQALERARKEADFVILSYHGGEEYIDAPVERTRSFVKEAMAAGVDAFIGHHPHVPQGVGWFGDRPAFYSLGNLVFDSSQNRFWTKRGMLARLELGPDHRITASVCPYLLEGHTPKPMASAEVAHFRRSLRNWSNSVGGSTIAEPDQDGCFAIAPPTPRSPRPAGPPPAGPKSDSPARH